MVTSLAKDVFANKSFDFHKKFLQVCGIFKQNKKASTKKKMISETSNNPISPLCKRRFSTILSLKTKLIQHQQQSDDHSEDRKAIENFAKHFVMMTNSSFPSKDEILETCSCPVCQETIVQRQQIVDYLKKQDDAEKARNDEKSQRKEIYKQKQEKIIEATTITTSSEMRSRNNTTNKNNGHDHVIHHQHQSSSSSKPKTTTSTSTSTSSSSRDEIFSDIRSLIQNLKDDALNVSQTMRKSVVDYERREHSLETQIQDTNKASKKAKETEQAMNNSGGTAGAMAEGLLRLCGKVMPMTVVNTFLRPIVESVFQMLWVVIAVIMSFMTIYLMVTAPKAR